MITIKRVEDMGLTCFKKHHWIVSNGEEYVYLKTLSKTTITNKFYIISKFVENLSKYHGEEFDNWFFKLLLDYEKNHSRRYDILFSNLDRIIFFVDKYIDSFNIDFGKFVDESKAKKNSILFKKDEIELINKLSGYLKIYSIFFNSDNLRLDYRLHKNIYNHLSKRVNDTEIIFKIFNVIRTKTFRYNLTDKFMWNYIKNIQCREINDHVIEIFNFIMNNILILCEEDRNPIIFFVTVTDGAIKWILRGIYKDNNLYEDSISTEDIHESQEDNFKTYAFNDTLGRLKKISHNFIYSQIEGKVNGDIFDFKTNQPTLDEKIIKFQNRLDAVEYISPLIETVTYPLLSKSLGIPFEYFKTITPKDSIIISYFSHLIFKRVFENKYKYSIALLGFYPVSSPIIMSTYKMKNVHKFNQLVDNNRNFYGYSTRMMPYDIISHFLGKLSRLKLIELVSGYEVRSVSINRIETELIDFYTNFFTTGKMEKEFKMIRNYVNINF